MRNGNLSRKYAIWGWIFVTPAALLIFIMSFYPMIQAFIVSMQTGMPGNLRFAGLRNYVRIFQDDLLWKAVSNVFIYLIVQVPIMLILALIFASILNMKTLNAKTFFRTMLFLPCAMALFSAALIFRSFFAVDGMVNSFLIKIGIVNTPVLFLTDPFWVKVVIIIIITWRWTGYNTIFYLAGMQSIDESIYESARIDGASSVQQFFYLTLPLLRPIILLTLIMSTNGTLQLFDETFTISPGGHPSVISISQYVYNLFFRQSPQLGYASAVSYLILIMVAILAYVQMKVGDKKQ